MVTHDEDAIFRYHDLELDVGGIDLSIIRICVKVAALVKGIAVDSNAALAGATDDLVPWRSNDPLDQMTRSALRRQANEFECLVPGRRVSRILFEPPTRIGEDHDVATLKVG